MLKLYTSLSEATPGVDPERHLALLQEIMIIVAEPLSGNGVDARLAQLLLEDYCSNMETAMQILKPSLSGLGAMFSLSLRARLLSQYVTSMSTLQQTDRLFDAIGRAIAPPADWVFMPVEVRTANEAVLVIPFADLCYQVLFQCSLRYVASR